MTKVKKEEVKKASTVRMVNLATYTSPEVIEVKNKDWIGYGEDNDYFQYLIDRYNGSPTNNAIINGITQMIFGNGLDATDSQEKPEEYAQMKALFSEELQERCASDLKAMGNCAIQVIYNEAHTRITECYHFPIETIRSGKCNADGEVNMYYYAPDWSKVNGRNKPQPIPAFGTSLQPIEILYVKPYKTGFYYYSPVDYQGALQYCELEEEISNYHLNNIMNGLAPSMMINFNNGVPTEEEQQDIERAIQQKFSGTSNAGRFILSFNDNNTNQSTLEPVQLSDAHNQYQFLSDESMRKIMVGHRVISPMLLGIKDNSGLGNNAEELKTASILMDNTTIRPFQNLLIKKGYNEILAFNNISLNLYIKTLQPLEFNDLTNAVNKTQVETETGQKLSKVPELTEELSKEILKNINQVGEKIDTDVWELVSQRKYDANNCSIEDWKLNLKVNLATGGYITSYPNEKSYLDETYYKVRYEYGEEYSSTNSREFCVNMMSRTASGVVYRKEDIDQASFSGVNNSFGHQGQNYSLFEFKGGVNCGHIWLENLYQRKLDANGLPVPDRALSSSEEVPFIDGYNPQPNGWDNAQIAPKDMPNNGHHPNYKG